MSTTIGKPQGTKPTKKARTADSKDNLDAIAAKLNLAINHEGRFDETSTRKIEEIPKTKSRKTVAKADTIDRLAMKPDARQHTQLATPSPLLRLYRIISLALSYFLQLPMVLLPGVKRPIFSIIGTIILLINYIVLTLFWVPTVLILLDFILLGTGLQDRSFVMCTLLVIFKYHSGTVVQLLRSHVLPVILNTIGAPSWAVSMLDKIPLSRITT